MPSRHRANTFGSASLLWQGPTIITVAEPPRNPQRLRRHFAAVARPSRPLMASCRLSAASLAAGSYREPAPLRQSRPLSDAPLMFATVFASVATRRTPSSMISSCPNA
jgi:hypothetical protein